ncbi:MAG: site-2 protease family protein [Phycisphaerae bacterium]|nr:site-2 protease family protein [Phycisphaerae bacterium]
MGPTGWWVADWWRVSPVIVIAWITWTIVSIVLHELAHGWAAIRCGDRTPIELGRMTWNPLVHMGPMSLLVFALTGLAWGLMPVSPSRFRGRYDRAWVALAGPAMNLGLAAVALSAGVLWIAIGGGYWFTGFSAPDPLHANTIAFLRTGAVLNVALAVFNLMPVPPLDGSTVVGAFIPGYREWLASEQGRIVVILGIVGLFYFGADFFFAFASRAVDAATVSMRAILHAS